MKDQRAKKIAFWGTGLMGRPMAERLLSSGHSLVVYNRTWEKAEKLRSSGAEVAQHPEDALRQTHCALVMVSDAEAVRQVLLSERARTQLSAHTVLQMSTIGPDESRQIAEEVRAAGGEYLEAPVLGSIPQVREGKLIIMVGATVAEFQRWSQLLRCFGSSLHHIGPVGKAAVLKLALNQLIATLTAGFALSLGLIQREGIPPETFMSILRGSALYAPTFEKKLPNMLKRDFSAPTFPSRHLLKDVDLILREAKRNALETSVLAALQVLLAKTVEQGLADVDYSSLFNIIAPRETGK